MRRGTCLLFVGIALMLVAGPLPAQQVDLSGTWTGDTRVPNSTENDRITLVLKKAGNSYSGSVTDSMGMANAAALENVKFADRTLGFEFVISANGENVRISTKLDYKDGKLTGSWSSDEGNTGSLDLARKP